jgi:ACS family hexuronate transporter-like MFS transporter
MAGGLGGVGISFLAGKLFDHYKSLGHVQTGYLIVFAYCAIAYVLAWLLMHALVPGMKRVEV